MGVLDWFKHRFKDEAEHYLYVEIPKERVRHTNGQAADDVALVANQHYLRLWLVEMFIKNDRDWFASWHPAVHSAVNLEFGDQQRLITRVSGPTNLKDVDKNHLDRVISLNHQLTSLIPFRGNTMGVDAGLLAMKGKDDLKTFISVLTSFSNLLAVPQLSSALAVASPLADGIGELMGATDGKLVLGLSQTYASQGGGGDAVLRAGYYAAVLTTAQELDPGRLWVVGDQLRFGASFEASQPLKGRHYMLLRIEARDERDDWDSLAAIQEPFRKALELAGQPEGIPQADGFIRKAIANAFVSDDLTEADRTRVVERIKQRYQERKQQFELGAFAEVEEMGLGEAMAGAMSVAEARARPPISAAEAFAGLDGD